MKRFNLVIVHTPREQAISDWQQVKDMIGKQAPDIDVRIVSNFSSGWFTRRWQESRPSLIFSASILRRYQPRLGKVHAGRAISKARQLERFAAAGIAVPGWAAWERHTKLDAGEWGERVIVKPAASAGGRGVVLVGTEALHRLWSMTTRNGTRRYLVQQFIDTGPRPSSYRALTLFGTTLYLNVSRANPARAGEPRSPADPTWRLFSNSSDYIDLDDDRAVIGFAKRMYGAIPEVPVQGCDIVREAKTGKLYALECNPIGCTWHFSSTAYAAFMQRTGRDLDYYSQFGGMRTVTGELIARTRAEASSAPVEEPK